MKKANIIPIFVILLTLLFSLTFGVNYVNLTANGGKSIVYASPGEEITIELEENVETSLTRNVFFLDYKSINWENGYKWIATPGIHMVRRYIRWKATTPISQVDDNDPTQDFSHAWVVIIVDEGAVDPNEFRHPGLMVTASQLEQIQQNILIDGHPMKKAWQAYKSDTDKRWLGHVSQAMDTLVMATVDKIERDKWDKDGKALEQLTLCWAISGDQRYADNAIAILNDWSYNNKSLRARYTSQYAFLHQTHYFGPWINAAELLMNYDGKTGDGSGWNSADKAQWQKYFREVFAPMTMGWGGHGNGVWNGQNQNLNVYKSRMMAAIHSNNRGMFDAASYLMFENERVYPENQEIHGKSSITYVEQAIGSLNHPGEIMEINRNTSDNPDWGHAGMCNSTITQMANFLWHQRGYVDNYDFYGLTIEGDTKPRIANMLDWITQFSIRPGGGEYTKTDFLNDGDNNNSDGAIVTSGGAVRSLYNQQVNGRTDRYTAFSNQFYNHYVYILGRADFLSADYKTLVSNGSGGTLDNLLNARLNDGWVSPDTAKDGATANIEKNLVSKLSKNIVSMSFNNSKMLSLNINGNFKVASVKIYNLTGKLIKNIAINKSVKTISLKNLNHGLFVAKH